MKQADCREAQAALNCEDDRTTAIRQQDGSTSNKVTTIATMCVQPKVDCGPHTTDVVQSLVTLVKQLRPSSRVIDTPNLHHNIVTLKSSSIDNGSNIVAND